MPLGSDEDLDILYSQYLENLKKVILKVNSTEDVHYCKRWIEAFNNCRYDQKIVRNCLVSMMYQQLDQTGRLAEPFIDLSKIYLNFKNIFVDDDSQDISTSKSLRNACDSAGGHLCSDIESQSAGNRSCNSDTAPPANAHQAKINELTKFIVGMKSVNDDLRNELKQVQKQKSILEMKVERKDAEMMQLLHLTRNKTVMSSDPSNAPVVDVIDSSNIPLSNRINSIIESYGAQKTTLGLPLARQATEEANCNLRDHSLSSNTSEKSSLSETKFFELMDRIAIGLEEYSNSLALSNDFAEGIDHLKFTYEPFERKDIELRVQAFQKRIQQAVMVAMRNVRSYSTTETRQTKNEHTAVQTDTEQIHVEKITTTKTTQTHSSQLRQGDGKAARDSLKINLLRRCVQELMKSRDKLAARYEKKIQENSIQEAIQRKLWKLQIASMRSHLQMNVVCSSQMQLCEVTEALESKYRSIISETFDKFSTNQFS